jgi:ankyrin repeat protein
MPKKTKNSPANDFNVNAVVDKATGQTMLHRALLEKKTDLAIVYEVLRLGADPNQADASGKTPMDIALKREWYDAADLLLEAGATPPKYDGAPDGPLVYKPRGMHYVNDEQEMARETPLTYYVKKGNFSHVYPILANGADINKKNKMNETPLEAAVRRGWPYMTRQLVRRGAWLDADKKDPNEVVDEKTGATRLLLMIQEGADPGAIKRILDDGASPDKADSFGLTPLALARAMKWPSIEKMLLERGANPNVTFPNPNQTIKDEHRSPLLLYASTYQNCHENYFVALIEAGADLNAADSEGKTTAYLTAMHGDSHKFALLMDKGADVLKPDKDGASALHLAVLNRRHDIAKWILDAHPEAIDQSTKDNRTPLIFAAGREDNDAVCQMLIQRGANVKAAGDYGTTPLHEAADKAKPEFLRQLIALGADVDAANKDGTTPMNEAITGDKPENLKVLLEAGASIDKAGQGKYYHPLFSLVNRELKHKGELAEILLEHGADPNSRWDKAVNAGDRGSVLYFAVSYSAYDVAEALLKAGADPHDTSYIGETAMHHCLHLRQVKGCELLLKYGFDPLRVFDYTQRWSGGGEGTRDVRHFGSAYDEAIKLDKQFGHNTEYGKMLDLIEEHLLEPAPAKVAPAAKKPGPRPA